MRDLTTWRTSPDLRSTARVATVAMAMLLGIASTDADPARPTQWTLVVSEKTGGADALSEHGTNSQDYLIPHVVEPLVRIELQAGERSWGVHPLGDPTLSRDEEKALRRGLVRRALDALQTEIQAQTVFR